MCRMVQWKYSLEAPTQYGEVIIYSQSIYHSIPCRQYCLPMFYENVICHTLSCGQKSVEMGFGFLYLKFIDSSAFDYTCSVQD